MLPILYLILTRRNGSPYPEVTVVSLPSSLMIVHSNAFVYSTSLLVLDSRYGYVFSNIPHLISLLVYLFRSKTNTGLALFFFYYINKKKNKKKKMFTVFPEHFITL